MDERRVEHYLYGFVILVVVVLAVVMMSGCATTDPPPCIPQVQVVEAPPTEILVVMPQANLAEPPVLESLTWTEDQIREAPSGYIAALWSDIQDLVNVWLEDHAELIRLNLAREAALENGAVENVDIDHD